MGDKTAFKKADKGFFFLITTVAHFSPRILQILCVQPSRRWRCGVQAQKVWFPLWSPVPGVSTQSREGNGHFQVLHQQVNPKFEFQIAQKKPDKWNFMSCSCNQPPAPKSLPKFEQVIVLTGTGTHTHTHLAGNHGLSFPFLSSRKFH